MGKAYIERSGRRTVRITDSGIVAISEIVNKLKIEAGTYIESLPVEDEFEIPDINFFTVKNSEIMIKLKDLNEKFNGMIENILKYQE